MINKKWIKQKIRQFLTLGIVVLLICPLNLAAKKKGAHLVIEKKDSQVIEGELLRVKEDSLLIKTSGSGSGVTIDITEIIKLKIKRKAKFGKGALIGFMMGGGLGLAFAGGASGNGGAGGNVDLPDMSYKGQASILMGVLGAGVGGVVGLMSRNYKEIQVKGKSPSQIEKIMKKLNKKARFKN